MPKELSKHKENTSYYDNRMTLISWKIEFIILNQSTYLDKIYETENIGDIISLIKSKLNSKQLEYINNDTHLQVLLKVEENPANKLQFYILETDKQLSEHFKYKTIIEFPTLYIIHLSELEHYSIKELPDEAAKEAMNLEFNKHKPERRYSRYRPHNTYSNKRKREKPFKTATK